MILRRHIRKIKCYMILGGLDSSSTPPPGRASSLNHGRARPLVSGLETIVLGE